MKWFVLASVIGVIAGLGTVVFLKLPVFGIKTASGFNYYYLLLPVIIYLSALISRTFAKEAEGHGTEKVIEAAHKRNGKINLLVVAVKLITIILTLSFGGSAGKEHTNSRKYNEH